MPGTRGTHAPDVGRRRAAPPGVATAVRALAAAGLLCAAAVGPAAAAETPPAAPRPADASAREATGPQGQRLWVSRTADVGDGEALLVRGTGFDVNKGIYIAFCLDTGPGNVPTPCGGGVDTSGTSGASQWISSNPPSYGTELAKPFGPGGTFEVTVAVSARIGVEGAEGGLHDCAVETCAVLTRADHTRTGDRSADVRVPVAFAADAGDSGSDSGNAALWWSIGPAAVVLLAVGGWYAARKRRGGTRADAASATAPAAPAGQSAGEPSDAAEPEAGS